MRILTFTENKKEVCELTRINFFNLDDALAIFKKHNFLASRLYDENSPVVEVHILESENEIANLFQRMFSINLKQGSLYFCNLNSDQLAQLTEKEKENK